MPDERSFFVVRYHPSLARKPSSAGLVVAGLLSSVIQGSSGALGSIWLAWGFLFLYFIWKFARWFTDYLVVTSERILIVTGVVTRKVTMRPPKRAADVIFQRSERGRLLRYGKFTVESFGVLRRGC